MHFAAHAAVGWTLAETGRGSRRFRQAVLVAALAPDIDVISLAFGQMAFGRFHHLATHSLIFSLLVSVIAVVFSLKGERIKTLLFTQLAFYLHYFGDYFLTEWPLTYWFPFSRTEYLSRFALPLAHPVNHIMNLLSLLVFIVLGRRFKRTAFEAVWPRLDRRICNLLFRPKLLACHICDRPANEHCACCGQAVCVSHAPVEWTMQVKCTECRTQAMCKPDDELVI